MNSNFKTFVLFIYTAVCIWITGVYYLNPDVTYDFIKITKVYYNGEIADYEKFFDVKVDKNSLLKDKNIRNINENVSFKKFKYSVLYSIIGLIVLLAFLIKLSKNKVVKKSDVNNFIGYWIQIFEDNVEGLLEGTEVKFVIFNDKKGNLKMVSWSVASFEEFQILNIDLEYDSILTTEIFNSNNFITYNRYSILDENTIKCTINNKDIALFRRLL